MPAGGYHECRSPRCPLFAVDRRGYCSDHLPNATVYARNYKGLSRSDSRFRWCRAAFLRDHPLCNVCGQNAATELDHVVPHKGDVSLYWDQSNWQGLCVRCHGRKTARESWRSAPASGAHLTVLCGAPGSGKSTWAGHATNVVSTDVLRSRPDMVDAVFRRAYAELDRLLRSGQSCVFDTTAAHPNTRQRALELAHRCGATASILVFDTDVELCVERQRDRADPVPVDVVRRVHADIARQIPRLRAEGWTRVDFIPARSVLVGVPRK